MSYMALFGTVVTAAALCALSIHQVFTHISFLFFFF